MECADAFSLATSAAARDEFGQSIVTNLDDVFIEKNVAWLEIAVNDAMIVQICDPGGNAVEPPLNFL